MKIVSTDPSNGHAELGSVESSTKDEVTSAVAAAHRAQKSWAASPLAERCGAVNSFADVARHRFDTIAQLIAAETGRPIASARTNVEWGIGYLNAQTEMAEQHLAPQDVYADDSQIHRVHFEPWGVVACILPWNFPFLAVAFQCSQALIAGNAIVYKNSDYNPLFGEMLGDLIDHSGIPNDTFRVLHGGSDVGMWITESDIDMLSFTGSSSTGRALAHLAAKRFIPYRAELGGSAACIVFEDADLDAVPQQIFDSRFMNCGQSCDAIKRLIVQESLFDEVITRLIEIARRTVVGPALEETTEIGPLVSERQRDVVESQVDDAIGMGAHVVFGARRPDGLEGSYYEPTLLTNVTTKMRVWTEETFGPVLPVVSFATEAEAIELANDSTYGLNGVVMSQDRDRLDRVGAQLKVGMVSENGLSPHSPTSPLGGYKFSGMGRTNGRFGFEYVTQTKVVARSR